VVGEKQIAGGGRKALEEPRRLNAREISELFCERRVYDDKGKSKQS